MVFSGGLWLTALRQNGDKVCSVTSYGAASNDFDYQTGPVGTGGSFTSSTYFCRSFKVTKNQVGAHLADLADGTLDQPIAEIMDWPGKDNARMPASAFGRDLAPFVDANGDGVYQPESGDYPDFRADEAVWWVTNDFGPHLESVSGPLEAEVQVLAQAYTADNHPASKAQLYSVKVINQGLEPLDSLALSLWVDPDVGCFTDDAIGSIPSRNALYAYNIDPVDGTNGALCDLGIPTYGQEPPMIFFQTLSSRLNGDAGLVRNSGMYLSNGSLGGIPQTTGPNHRGEYFDVTHARWLDGLPLTLGGEGYNGTIPTNWVFSGMEVDNVPWLQCQDSRAQDKRLLLNVNLKEVFNPRDEFEVDFLVSIVPAPITYPCPDLGAAVMTLDSITDYVQNTVVSSNQTPRAVYKSLSLKPNPTSAVFSISIGEGQSALQSATLFDGLGRVVEQYGASTLTRTIDVAHLPRGVYSLIARDASGEMYQSRVVLQ